MANQPARQNRDTGTNLLFFSHSPHRNCPKLAHSAKWLVSGAGEAAEPESAASNFAARNRLIPH